MRRQQSKRAAQLPVACFYCEERFSRTQERATHIRHHHKGKPYRPDMRELQEMEHQTAPTVAPEPERPTARIVVDGKLVDVLAPSAPPEDMTTTGHLVAAISSIKRRMEDLDKRMPELQMQLDGMRAAQKQMETERQALETALKTIDNEALEQIHHPVAAPVAKAK